MKKSNLLVTNSKREEKAEFTSPLCVISTYTASVERAGLYRPQSGDHA